VLVVLAKALPDVALVVAAAAARSEGPTRKRRRGVVVAVRNLVSVVVVAKVHPMIVKHSRMDRSTTVPAVAVEIVEVGASMKAFLNHLSSMRDVF